MKHLFSNEVVFRGHPDKVCDQVSATILQHCLRKDPNTRAGIEVVGGKGMMFVTGELTTKSDCDVVRLARKTLREIGYGDDIEVVDNLGRQSPDIAIGVDIGGAGDQGIIYGYACDESEEKLPVAMLILQRFSKLYDEAFRAHSPLLGPDGKAQITGVYENGRLTGIDTFLISYQNSEEDRERSDSLVLELASKAIAEHAPSLKTRRFLINPAGRFRLGGFSADAGLTGRKIVVDSYQGFAPVGGGCMNGKDPTKVDFSAAHMARRLACENLGDCRSATVQLSYAIGKAEPVSVTFKYVGKDGGVTYANGTPEQYARCTPASMRAELGLDGFDFVGAAAFGHFTGIE